MPEPVQVFTPPQPNTHLRALIGSRHDLVISGAHLNAGLLRRFYARRDFGPVWATRRPQANALVAAVLRAGDQGLDPELFHATLLRQGATLSPLERELVLSDAALSYADALARGAVPVERRRDDEVLAPEPIDVAAVLDAAADEPDPARVIESLAPATPTYRALRQALQDGRSGPRADNKAAATRLRTIEVNLERQRWLPRRLPADRAWVNVADQRLVLYRAGEPVFSTRVVVGEDVLHNQSPEFRATIDASFYNPPWVIPADIAKAEIIPKLTRDPEYLTRNKMVLLADGDVEQLPGPEAGLGLIMFDMPNRFDVYLHDTPDRDIFSLANRRISHGCIRVQYPRDFAALLMDLPIDAINHGIAAGSTTRNDLHTPVPVFVVYQTAFVDTGGVLQFRPDFYNRDPAIWRSLHGAPPEQAIAAQADNRPVAPKPVQENRPESVERNRPAPVAAAEVRHRRFVPARVMRSAERHFTNETHHVVQPFPATPPHRRREGWSASPHEADRGVGPRQLVPPERRRPERDSITRCIDPLEPRQCSTVGQMRSAGPVRLRPAGR